jgi:hydrogenase 3 maturation protease
MKPKVVLTVGNALMGDDAAGVLLAQMLAKSPVEGWQVVNGGSAPENVLHRVRELDPELVLVVDAADMDLPAGTVQRIPEDSLQDPFLFTTHTLPLTFLIESLREFTPQVELLGIQPEVVAFGYPISAAVDHAVKQVYAALKNGTL